MFTTKQKKGGGNTRWIRGLDEEKVKVALKKTNVKIKSSINQSLSIAKV